MIKIDLITGFLGSGKTTFIKKYARYLLDRGMHIGILENDYGAVNVDMMLLQELRGENCEIEMVAGGCDADCHRRRFKTKLIAMGMSGYDRVLVEPSGIFDMDEFFDALYEEPLCRWYEIGNVIAIVDAKLPDKLSGQSEFLLANEIADAGKVVLSRSKEATRQEIENTIAHLNRAMEYVKCKRRFKNELLVKDWAEFDAQDYEDILKCGYVAEDYVKSFDEDHGYKSLYFMNKRMSVDSLKEKAETIMQDSSCGNIFRIKGFLLIDEEDVSADAQNAVANRKGERFIELNATKQEVMVKPIAEGQEILIVIGEDLNEDRINSYFENTI